MTCYLLLQQLSITVCPDPTFRPKTAEDLFKTDASKMKENRSWKQTKWARLKPNPLKADDEFSVLKLLLAFRLCELTKIEEDEFGLDGGTQFDNKGDGDVDHQQPQHQPLQPPQESQPEERPVSRTRARPGPVVRNVVIVTEGWCLQPELKLGHMTCSSIDLND